jgi:hypothetical protein
MPSRDGDKPVQLTFTFFGSTGQMLSVYQTHRYWLNIQDQSSSRSGRRERGAKFFDGMEDPQILEAFVQ